MTAPGHKYLSEEALRRIAEERGWKLAEPDEKPEIHVFDVHGQVWRGVKREAFSV
jgi:hypothetical protein